MQIQKLSYLHLGLNLISGPQNTKSERHSNDVDFFWKPLIKIRFFDRLWPLALWGPILENNLVQDEVFPNWRWRGLHYMKMPRAGRAFSKFASAKPEFHENASCMTRFFQIGTGEGLNFERTSSCTRFFQICADEALTWPQDPKTPNLRSIQMTSISFESRL